MILEVHWRDLVDIALVAALLWVAFVWLGRTRARWALLGIAILGAGYLLARQLKIQHMDPCLKMAAVFTHFEGALRDEGIDEGATLVLHTAGKKSWFWYIPLPDDRVSVGVVGAIKHLIHNRQGDPQRITAREPLVLALEKGDRFLDLLGVEQDPLAADANQGHLQLGQRHQLLQRQALVSHGHLPVEANELVEREATAALMGGELGFSGLLEELSYQASTTIRACWGNRTGSA